MLQPANNNKIQYQRGQIPVLPKKKQQKLRQTLTLQSNPVNQRLSQNFFYKEYFKQAQGQKVNAIDHGRLMHRMLERINCANDVEKIVRSFVFSGEISNADLAWYVQKINKCIEDVKVSSWFKSGLHVKTEPEILLPNGGTKRPDRVIFIDSLVVILDYKFGNHVVETDSEQVLGYKQAFK
ncbi:MAG: hypothetical protein HC896_11780, partial [Bacteroidales bacterium]|nr:hypothetical protein [Bacteroidales bacterium]